MPCQPRSKLQKFNEKPENSGRTNAPIGYLAGANISANFKHVIGLKADGTVVAAGWNENGECDVEEWEDIVAISTGASHTIGLKADGTLVAAGNNKDGRCDVEGWQDILVR